ncbi:MAG: DUF1593 domain-containing protein [Chitinophagaceae bacterium]|nr:DUF1593 domain-containing protein [Chitinophagaceae bacterium]
MNLAILFLSCLTLIKFKQPLNAQTIPKFRVMILTDIEADPDDAQSMVRFLTYANQWDIEGLIATTSIHQKTRVAPETIHKILQAYQKVQPNLLKHEKGYPAYEELKTKVKKGLPVYGMNGVGAGKDSEGSEWIINTLKKNDSRPLWIPAWGGTNCLAQALWKIRQNETTSQAQKLYDKIRVYTISDQDDSGPWIRKTFPSIFYIASPGYTYGHATWLGIAFPMPGSDKIVTGNEWLAENIQQGHGPMGAAYPDVAYGMEGDSPAFLYLVPNGLNEPEHPNYGGWGGRYEFYTPSLKKDTMFARPDWPEDEPESRSLWTNAEDSVVSAIDKQGYKSIQATIWRWRTEFQNDFAARMDWCTKSFSEANHPPIPALVHKDLFTVRSGEQFHLNAEGTQDPDGDSMSYLWFQYKEAGTYPGTVSFRPYAANLYDLPVTAPPVDSPKTIHFILKVTDKGKPALTRYKRVIVTVVPK